LNDNKIYDKLCTIGDCSAVVHLSQNCLDKAIDEFPARDQVTELNELAELTAVSKTLIVIIRSTSLDEIKVGKAILSGYCKLSMYHDLQWRGCCGLRNLVLQHWEGESHRIGSCMSSEGVFYVS
jgi:hypothetical protein